MNSISTLDHHRTRACWTRFHLNFRIQLQFLPSTNSNKTQVRSNPSKTQVSFDGERKIWNKTIKTVLLTHFPPFHFLFSTKSYFTNILLSTFFHFTNIKLTFFLFTNIKEMKKCQWRIEELLNKVPPYRHSILFDSYLFFKKIC